MEMRGGLNRKQSAFGKYLHRYPCNCQLEFNLLPIPPRPRVEVRFLHVSSSEVSQKYLIPRNIKKFGCHKLLQTPPVRRRGDRTQAQLAQR